MSKIKEIIKYKKTKIVSSEEALKDVEPFLTLEERLKIKEELSFDDAEYIDKMNNE